MAKSTEPDYIPTYADIEHKRDVQEQFLDDLKKKGFHLGEYELTYKVNGMTLTEKKAAHTKAEAVEQLKEQCRIVGWMPYSIEAKTLVEPNIYV